MRAVAWLTLGAGWLGLMSQAAAQEAEASQFREAVLAHWRALAQQIQTSTQTCEVEFWRPTGDRPLEMTRKDVVRYVLAPGGTLMEYTSIENIHTSKHQKMHDLTLINKYYKAALGRSAQTGEYVVFHCELHEAPEKGDEVQQKLPWTMCANVPLGVLLGHGSVTAVRLERPKAGVVRLHFVCQGREKGKAGAEDVAAGIQVGYIDFDEGEPYRVLGYEFKRETKVSQFGEVGSLEYGEPQGRFPVVRRQTVERQTTRSKFGVRRSREVYIYDISYNQAVPDDVFRLSHYGLPEPVGVVWEKRTPVYVWLFVAAGVLLTLGIFFRWLARRLRHGPSEG